MMQKRLLIPVTLAMHTKLKWAARQEGRSMSSLVRGLIQAYLNGEVEPGDGKLPPRPRKPRKPRKRQPEAQDVFDELGARFDELGIK